MGRLADRVADLARDGETVELRAIRPDDAPRQQAFHARLSPESICLRWLSAYATLMDEAAQALSRLAAPQLKVSFVILNQG